MTVLADTIMACDQHRYLFAVVITAGVAVVVVPMPINKGVGKGETVLDVAAIVAPIGSIRDDYEIRLAVVERVHFMPFQGVASTFTFGRGFGGVLGAIKALGLPMPQAWQKAILAGTPGDKPAAIQYATSRFPSASLLATARSRTPSDGIADALCLAEWGRRVVVGATPGRKKG